MFEKIVFISAWILLTFLLLFLRSLILQFGKRRKRRNRTPYRVASEAELNRMLRKVRRHKHPSLKLVTPIYILVCLAVLPTFAQQPNDNGVKLGAKANPVAASASKVEKEPEPANFFLKLEAPGIAIIKKNDALTK